MRLIDQIIQQKSGSVAADQTSIHLPIDHVYGHDRNTFKIINEFGDHRRDRLEDARALDRLRLYSDHYAPPPTSVEAGLHAQQEEIARTHGLVRAGAGEGVGHQIAVERLVSSWEVAVGVDSHTCTVGGLGALGLRQPPPAVAEALATGQVRFDIPSVVRIELTGALNPPANAKDIILTLARRHGRAAFADRLLEFGGEGLASLPLAQRFTLANLSVDIEARGALCETDAATRAYLAARGREAGPVLKSDPGDYTRGRDQVIPVDLSAIEPMVAAPGSLYGATPLHEVEETRLDQITVGSCTNGRIEDFEAFAQALGPQPVAPGLRVIATPASREIAAHLLSSGLHARLFEAGVTLNPPGCGPCMGLHQGVLADGEVCLATGSRNGAGRMGSPTARVFIASPAVAGRAAARGALSPTLFDHTQGEDR